jgi:hypothetical protein
VHLAVERIELGSPLERVGHDVALVGVIGASCLKFRGRNPSGTYFPSWEQAPPAGHSQGNSGRAAG